MKKTILVIIIIFLLIVGVGYYTGQQIEDPSDPNDSEEVTYERDFEFLPEEGIEAQKIKVVENGEEIYLLTIDELTEWADENWDAFEEPPTVAMREIDPTSFGFFDRAASISPDGKKIAFSVSDYSAATTTAILIIADLQTEQLNFVTDPAQGSIEVFNWSEDGSYLGYTLGTARAGGDGLRVDDVANLEKSFSLTGEDLFEVIDPEDETLESHQFMPVFNNLEWDGEDLLFTSGHPETEEDVHWRIGADGEGLVVEDYQ